MYGITCYHLNDHKENIRTGINQLSYFVFTVPHNYLTSILLGRLLSRGLNSSNLESV